MNIDAFTYWSERPLKDIHWAITAMASDADAFTTSDRKAILEVTALLLGKMANGVITVRGRPMIGPLDDWNF